MKKLVFLFLTLILLSLGSTCFAGTYETILTDNGYTDIHNNYLDRPQLKSILEIIFKKTLTYNTDQVGHATGTDFFEMVEKEIGMDGSLVVKKESYFRRALTFASLSELLDYYFPEISKLHGLDSVPGKLSKADSGYVLTYENGKVMEFSEFEFFKMTDKLCDVWVILKENKVIDVCRMDRDIPFSGIALKKEVEGNLYLVYDKGIIIEANGEFYEYPKTSSFKFINMENAKKVVLILGDYKRSKNMAAVAIGRTE